MYSVESPMYMGKSQVMIIRVHPKKTGFIRNKSTLSGDFRIKDYVDGYGKSTLAEAASSLNRVIKKQKFLVFF